MVLSLISHNWGPSKLASTLVSQVVCRGVVCLVAEIMTNLTFLTKDPPIEKLSQSGRVGSRIFFEAVMAPINEMNHSNQHSLFMTEATQCHHGKVMSTLNQ